ncbi:DUF6274 family protein [Streptomyces tirandamycinicus]|uniref:Uncharacterized protein n=1 Tax=Streptomyces tirandamycinicus TaxID=2174846 RepID=A0A2S1SU21_9ACTN|nr:DUF6274 family protein [Streptomyces tirandamycinicus]AWI29797.1 hypothetical protein DDW44_14135 [Streptomyces tirandamycinicus]
MAASTARHETRALLRAHLAAFSGYRHLTRQCPVCHRLLRLAMDPAEAVPEEPAPPSAAALGGRQTPFVTQALGSRESQEDRESRQSRADTTGTSVAAGTATAAGRTEPGATATAAEPGTAATAAGTAEPGAAEAGHRAGSGAEDPVRP